MSPMSQSRSSFKSLLARIDARLYLWVGFLERRFHLYKIARAVSFSGDGYCYLIIAALLLILSPQAGLSVTMVAFLAFAFELPSYVLLKKTFKRRRPYEVVANQERIHVPSDEFSFPSGHTAGGFLMATVVSHFFPSAAAVMFSWAAAIGVSRVLLRVHFVSDVIAGSFLGIGFATLALSILGHS